MNENAPSIGRQQVLDLLLLNLAMLFISTSGVLGRHVSLPPEVTIFWRAGLASLLLIGICLFQNIPLFKESRKELGLFALSGFLMMVHWVAYFYALQLSNVAIGMLSLFTYPVITAILEPILLGTSFQKRHILLGGLTLVGIYFLAPSFDFENSYVKAIGYGTLSSFTYSLRNILMKKSIPHHNGLKLMLYQTVVITLLLIPFGVDHGMGNVLDQWWAILLLALLTTVIGHTLFLMSFRKFSVTTASIMSCIQPIYGIVLAMIFLSEFPEWRTWIGGGLIVFAVLIESTSSTKNG